MNKEKINQYYMMLAICLWQDDQICFADQYMVAQAKLVHFWHVKHARTGLTIINKKLELV